MKRIRSTGLILIAAGLLSTSGPTWAAGHSTNRSPWHPGISIGILNALSGLRDSVLAGFQTLFAEGDPATLEQEKGDKEPVLEPSPTPVAAPPIPPPTEGGGCIDPNGCPQGT